LSSPAYIQTTFVWHSMGDACLQCAQLNGSVFTDQDIFQSTVWSPFWGDVWDLDAGHPLTHGHTGINCRCTLEVHILFDWSKIRGLETLQYTLSTFTRGGGEVTAWRSVETGRFVSGAEVRGEF
jgi:hypothetical protein